MEGNGTYRLELMLGDRSLRVTIDTGLNDPLGEVGLEVEAEAFDFLQTHGHLTPGPRRTRRDASGRVGTFDTATVTAQMIDPATHQRIGPAIQVGVLRRPRSVLNRVGTAFFHRLVGCNVFWDLDHRIWCIEYP
jgi:hypothetical protein